MSTRLSAALLHQVCRRLVRYYPSAAALPIALVDPSRRRIYVVQHFLSSRSYPISISRYGLGSLDNSFKTPVGAHRVAEKIGNNAPLYTQFIGRQARGQLSPDAFMTSTQDDAICTRILRLEGLEWLVNQGGYFDSYQRCIYIHGTPDENHIPQPTSIGCIRMRNADVVSLFDTLKLGSLVYIFNFLRS